tara:strand:+ start:298 stop:486 length:189 start_codon:yes stop_codon:yes gene_type:complete
MKVLIRKIREEKSINRRQLSRLTGISERSLLHYENEEISPSLKHLSVISQSLECSISDLYSE